MHHRVLYQSRIFHKFPFWWTKKDSNASDGFSSDGQCLREKFPRWSFQSQTDGVGQQLPEVESMQ